MKLALTVVVALSVTPFLAACGGSGRSVCSRLRPAIETITGEAHNMARALPGSPLPDVRADAITLRATVIKARRQVRAAKVTGPLQERIRYLEADLLSAERALRDVIGGVGRDGIDVWGPRAQDATNALIAADEIGDEFIGRCE